MRPRTLTAIAALALALPVAVTQASPRGGTADNSASRKVEVAFSFDGPGVVVSPVAGQDGSYTLAQRLWSRQQRVHWFTLGPPAAIGSMPVRTFAALIAAHATTDAAAAPVAHISYRQSGRVKNFLATVSAAESGLGSARAPVHTVTLAPISRARVQEIAGRRGLLSVVASRCLTSDCDAIGGSRASNEKIVIPHPLFGVGNCAGEPKSCLGQEILVALSQRELNTPRAFVGPGGEALP